MKQAATPFFSVIIPTLNEEQYVPKLLASLSHQRFHRFEVIVVDGKSKDRTITVSKRYAKKLPQLTILTSAKQHVSYQRNLGALKARGKFLIFLDADVTVPPEYLTKVYKAVAGNRVKLLTTWHKSDTDEPMDEFLNSLGNIMMEVAKLVDKPFSGGWNTIIRSDIFAKLGGYDERFKFAEDHDLVLRASEAGHELAIIRDVKITFCMRRFRHYGYFKAVRTYAMTSIHALINKGIIEEVFEYPMGGHTYKKKHSPKKKFVMKHLLTKILDA